LGMERVIFSIELDHIIFPFWQRRRIRLAPSELWERFLGSS